MLFSAAIKDDIIHEYPEEHEWDEKVSRVLVRAASATGKPDSLFP